jgi:microcystin-dependent protein
MSDQFLGEIRIFPFNFAPTGWAMCNGQILPISQNTALFSLLGTNFGGDGQSNFALPNLQGCVPLDMGNGAGLSQRIIGETSGEAGVVLLSNQMPGHNHQVLANTSGGNTNAPASATWAVPHLGKTGINAYTTDTAHNVSMSASALSMTGGGQPHNNMSPYLVMNFCIAQTGIFPPRS